jgi:DNA primase
MGRDYTKYAGRLLDYLGIKGVEIKDGKCRCLDPAHEDKNPSCVINQGFFHCFSCGVGGDIYDAVQLLEETPLIDREKQFDFLENLFSNYYKMR